MFSSKLTESIRTINQIIIHCSATPEGRDYTAADIDRWHRQRGFNGIGYHYVIRLDGTIEHGRPVEQIGAHCKGHNATTIGVCYIGGLATDCKTPQDTRTPAQKNTLRRLCQSLLQQYPNATVHGHCEFANKACPCFDVQQWLRENLLPA